MPHRSIKMGEFARAGTTKYERTTELEEGGTKRISQGVGIGGKKKNAERGAIRREHAKDKRGQQMSNCTYVMLLLTAAVLDITVSFVFLWKRLRVHRIQSRNESVSAVLIDDNRSWPSD